MSDIWMAVFDGAPDDPMIPHPDADEVVSVENFAGWVRVTTDTDIDNNEMTAREIGHQTIEAVLRKRRSEGDDE